MSMNTGRTETLTRKSRCAAVWVAALQAAAERRRVAVAARAPLVPRNARPVSTTAQGLRRLRWSPHLVKSLLLGLVLLLPCQAPAQVLHSPARLTLSEEGRVAVTDTPRGRVVVLDAVSLEQVDVLLIEGKPLGIAHATRRLYVGNETTGSVEIWTLQNVGQRSRRGTRRVARMGRRRGSVAWRHSGWLGNAPGVVPGPTDIAVDENSGIVLVVSSRNRSVLAFTLDGAPLGTLVGPGPEPNGLVQPTAITLDTTAREILVSDFGDVAVGGPASVRIYDYDGNLLAQISGNSGQEGFEFSRPQGLAVNGAGQIFLVDSLLGQVLVFDRQTLEGTGTLGSYGTGVGQLLLPQDIVIHPTSMTVLVTNNRMGRVEVFEQGGIQP